jgi:hypothetical protein
MLHQDHPSIAEELLTADGDLGMYGKVFVQWLAAVRAEAAVLSGSSRASAAVEAAQRDCAGNPMAAAIATRAAVLLGVDAARLESIADTFGRNGAPYQRDRTLALAAARTR